MSRVAAQSGVIVHLDDYRRRSVVDEVELELALRHAIARMPVEQKVELARWFSGEGSSSIPPFVR